MLKIDSHQHFWKYDPVKDQWITNDMIILQNDFLPGDIKPILHYYGISGCVAVQSIQSEDETDFLLDLASQYSFIQGVVGWVDLLAADIEDRLEHYAQFEKIKGFRHILQNEKNKKFMLNTEFKRGIAKLNKFNFTYDILITEDQLPYVEEFIAEFPAQKFVINHLAKPDIKQKNINGWKNNICQIATHENVFCKISGMVTEVDWNNWKASDFKSYLDVMFEAFGPERLMFGSDWPVCRLAATYGQVLEIVDEYISALSNEEQHLFWGSNTENFYNLCNNTNGSSIKK